MRARAGADVAEYEIARALRDARRSSPRTRHETLLRAYDAFFGTNARAHRGRALRDAPYEDTGAAAIARERRFVRDEAEDARRSREWGVRLARRYHDKLFKTYCVCDLSRVEEARGEDGRARVGMRWRTEDEVRRGKGQFTCAERRCERSDGLRTFECHFAYNERGERKSALVKVRACEACAKKLGVSDGFTRVDEDGVEHERRARRERKKSKKRRRDERDDGRTARDDVLRGLL